MQQELPKKILSKPKSIKELRLALKRLHIIRKTDKKLASYSLSDLIYNPHHPTGYISPILTVMTDKGWEDIQNRNVPLMKSEFPKTEKRFADLLRIDSQIHKYEYKQLQKTLAQIAGFRRWLPKTGGQLDRQFPLNRPGRFIRSFYDYIVLDRQYDVKSIWDLNINKQLFRQFLDDYYIADAAGFAKDVSLYLDDYLRAQTEVPPGKIRVKFKKEVRDMSSPNGFAHYIDQIVCLPTKEAEYYIAKNKAVEYSDPEPRCKSFAARLDLSSYL
jgi:hypothetical protein